MPTKPTVKKHRPTQAELDAMKLFLAALQAGRNPGVERFLARYPEFARTLQPVLEAMTMIAGEYRQFTRRFPDVDIEELCGVPKTS